MFSTPRRRLGWLAALTAVLSLGYASRVQQKRYADAQATVHHTLAVQRAISETLSLLKDAETGQRGFLLTGDVEFLGPNVRARAALPAQFAEVRELVATDPAQAQSLQKLEALATEKLAELGHTVELRQQGRADEALAIVEEGYGRRLMLDVRAQAQAMLQRESENLLRREAAARSGWRDFTYLIAGAWASFLAIVGAGFWLSARGVAEKRRAEERLKENERALRALADNASDLVRVIDPESRTLYVSPSCKKLLGFTQAEMRALPPGFLMPEQERPAAVECLAAVKAGAESASYTHRLRSKSGDYRWFETNVRRALDLPPGHLQLTARDVTERKLAELALQRQTARLESILASIGDGIVVVDEEQRVLKVNPAAREFILHDEGELLTAESSKRYQAYLLDGVTPFPPETGPITRALAGEVSDGVEMILRDRHEVRRAFSVTARPIRDQRGVGGCVAVYRDITVQLEAERRVLESEQRLRVLSEASFEGVAIMKDGHVLDTNSLFAEWLGYDPTELLGVPGLQLVPREEHEHVREMSSRPDVTYETTLLRKNGSTFPVEIRGRFMVLRGQPVRIAVVRDITDRRQREAELKQHAEALRSMSLRDELTGLFNRRGFFEHAERDLRSAKRSRKAGSLFFIDLNGMKAINDSLGHELGDRALIATAKVLCSVFREADIVSRLGGDEFAVFAVECGANDCKALTGRLRANIEVFNERSGQPFSLSVSVGSAVFEPESARNLTALIEIADQNMYADKRAQKADGRNEDAERGVRALA